MIAMTTMATTPRPASTILLLIAVALLTCTSVTNTSNVQDKMRG